MSPRSTASAATRFRETLEWTLGRCFQAGNRVEILKNGVEIFPAMLRAVHSAERSIDFVTFVYWRGEIAVRFARSLAARARAGVRVRVVLDGYGAKPMDPDLTKLMERSGVELRWFRPPHTWWKVWKADSRTHRKILVCDGRVAFTGGVGIGEEWEGDARNPNEWRETHLRIEGPAVRGLEGAFLGNWAEAGGDVTEDIGRIPPVERRGDVEMMTIGATAAIGWSDIAALQRAVIAAARERLRITTAYFVPDATTLEQLALACSRGVRVEVLVPGPHHDERLSQIASEAVYGQVLGCGVRAWRYQRTMLHAKVITADGVLAVLGSANMNHRSLLKDDEVCVAILDEGIVRTLDDHFEADLAHAEPLELREWTSRNPIHRVKEAVVRHLLAPQL